MLRSVKPLDMLLLWYLLYISLGAQQFELTKYNICGICREVESGLPCEWFAACDVFKNSLVADGCSKFCMPQDYLWKPIVGDSLEVRVSKGFGTKSYNLLRISVITTTPTAPVNDFFDYSGQFQYRWQQFYLHTAMKYIKPGVQTSFNVGTDITVTLPSQGAGISGVLIADPCVSGNPWMGCEFGKAHETATRIPALINAFTAGASGKYIDFWSITGDNFYDRSGVVTQGVFASISLEAKSKILATVPGNHDYWVFGAPEAGSTQDQCGNGFMQYYSQDSKAAEGVVPGSTAAPFDFSINPGLNRTLVEGLDVANGCNLPAADNFFWYNQIGNVGMVGQSGAYALDVARPYMTESCTWLAQQDGLDVVLLFGHWDVAGLGAEPDMAMPQWYEDMRVLPGCSDFDQRGMLKFVMGHTHCNSPHPHGKVNAGFRVAGFGMGGCGNFGIPIVDTTDKRVRFWYFDTSRDALYNEVMGCVQAHGWRQCTNLATKWLDEPLVPSPSPSPGPSPGPSNCPAKHNGNCCMHCPYNLYCPSDDGCYATGQPGCAGGYCPAPAENQLSIVV